MTRAKQIVKWGLGALGFRLARVTEPPAPFGLDLFFWMLKSRGFAPKHIIDVGANHGHWTRTALRFFPDAYYTLIEPQSQLREHVIDLIEIGRVQWISAGAGDKIGSLPFTVCSYRDDGSSFLGGTGHQMEIPVTTLNEVVLHTSSFPDMVKIDAEGFDLKVLAGASDLFDKTEIFLIEAAVLAQFENTVSQVMRTMARAGYRLLDITDIHRTVIERAIWLCDLAFIRNDSTLIKDITSYDVGVTLVGDHHVRQRAVE